VLLNVHTDAGGAVTPESKVYDDLVRAIMDSPGVLMRIPVSLLACLMLAPSLLTAQNERSASKTSSP